MFGNSPKSYCDHPGPLPPLKRAYGKTTTSCAEHGFSSRASLQGQSRKSNSPVPDVTEINVLVTRRLQYAGRLPKAAMNRTATHPGSLASLPVSEATIV